MRETLLTLGVYYKSKMVNFICTMTVFALYYLSYIPSYICHIFRVETIIPLKWTGRPSKGIRTYPIRPASKTHARPGWGDTASAVLLYSSGRPNMALLVGGGLDGPRPSLCE